MAKGFGSPVLSLQQQREEQLLRKSVLQHFQHLPDPRTGRHKTHNLEAIVTIGILAVLCGADGFVAIEIYGKANQAWLETFLDLPFGIPSHDTFGRVFGMLEPHSQSTGTKNEEPGQSQKSVEQSQKKCDAESHSQSEINS